MKRRARGRRIVRWFYLIGWTLAFAAVLILVAYRLNGLELNLRDMDAYWNAAIRWREGVGIYESGGRLDGEDIFRYAPWFAAMWVPLTFLPKATVGMAWVVVLIVATAAALLPAISTRSAFGISLALLFGSFLVWQVSYGNVHPLMVMVLVFGVERRSSPVWIALCASLKGSPLLFVLVLAARGQWRQVAWTLCLTFVLVAPMLAFDLSTYPLGPGNRPSLLYLGVPAYIGIVLASIWVALLAAKQSERFAWLAASVAAVISVPRLLAYDLTYMLVGIRRAVRPAGAPPGGSAKGESAERDALRMLPLVSDGQPDGR